MRDTPEHSVVHHARGRMLTRAAAEVSVRGFTRVTDEPPGRGGEDRAPTPLEHILIALCG